MNPNHNEQVKRLNKIQGQVKGITGMIEDRRYCMDILIQIKAVTSALKKVELGIMEGHIKGCLQSAIEKGDQEDTQVKIEEIMKLIALHQ